MCTQKTQLKIQFQKFFIFYLKFWFQKFLKKRTLEDIIVFVSMQLFYRQINEKLRDFTLGSS